MLNTVAGDDRARAILAPSAVDEDGLIAEERQNGPNLVRSRRGPGTEGYAHVVHTQGRDFLALPQCVAAFFAEIDHQLYALRVQFLEGDIGGYRAAIQVLVYFAKIMDVNRLRRAGPTESRCRKQRSENRCATDAEEDWPAERADSGRWWAAEGLLLQPCHIEWCFVS